MAETALTGTAQRERGVPLLLRFRNVGVLAVLLLLVIGSAILTPKHTFIGIENLQTLVGLGPELGVIALAVGVLMIAGEFDLSVGSILAVCAFAFAGVLRATGSPWAGALAALILGGLCGALNGVIVVRGNVVSFIATLGTMLSLRGLTEILSGGIVRTVPVADHPLFLALTTGKVAGAIPVQFIWFVLIGVVLYFVLARSRLGNWIYATGDQLLAARAMGIRTGDVKVLCFVLVGLTCGLAAVLQTARVTAFSVHMGEGFELRAVAAAVVGGTALTGGRGNMVGIFLGTLVIIVVDNMISQLRLAYEWTYVVFGLVILCSALLDLFIEKQIERAGAR